MTSEQKKYPKFADKLLILQRKRGVVQKSKYLVDVIYGSPLTAIEMDQLLCSA